MVGENSGNRKPPLWDRITLRKKILLLTTVGMVIILGLFSLVSILAVQRSVQNALAERLTYTQQQANSLDFILGEITKQTEARLSSSGNLLLKSSDGGKREVLEEWRKAMFVQPLYLSLLDSEGKVVLTQPDSPLLSGTNKSSLAYIQRTLARQTPETSDAFLDPGHNTPVAYIAFPILGAPGNLEGILEVAFNPMSPEILSFIKPTPMGDTAHAEVVDSSGIVLSSTRPELLLQKSDHGDWLASQVRNKNSAVSTCHSCHEPARDSPSSKEIITFAPLATAPWGIVVRQDEDEALATSRRLQRELAALGLLSLFLVAFVAWVTTENVARPIRLLNTASLRLATGDLSKPVPLVGGGEVATLAASFETMRNKLNNSLEQLTQRTRQLEKSERLRSQLLRNLISSEEEKRKHIARDLHDETSQAITSLLVGLQAIADSPPMQPGILTAKLNILQDTAKKTLEEIHKVIYELRPSIIDDLGLVPAIKWYAEGRLEDAGIKLYLETAGHEKRLSPEIEIAIYRIVQEAVTNVIKYSGAEVCSITMDFEEQAINMHIEDDGRGFDPARILSSSSNSGQQHFGILGMKERVELLNGSLKIVSEPGKGTEIELHVPYGKKEMSNEQKDQGFDRG